MAPDSPQMFGVALMALWGAAGAVALGRSMAKSPAARELAAAIRKMNLVAKGALVAGLVCAVAIGGTKPGGGNPPRNTPNTRNGSVSSVCSVVDAPSVGVVEVRTNNVTLRAESASAVEVEDWRKHGSSSGGVWLDFEEPVFRIGTNPVSRAYVAANGAISFDSMHRPPDGAPLPDGTGLPALAPLLAPLGMVPEANWTNAGAASRFWHDASPGRGRILTWEDALLDRLPGRRLSFQAELRPSGDFTCRYDFADALDPPATNLVIGAQAGTNGVNALAILGTNLLAATVWRVDGARVTNGVSIADLLCTNGVLRTPARFAIEWKNTSGLDLNADTDGDGLSDGDEIYLYGTDPRCEDTDGDGLSDSSEILSGADPLDADENDDGVPDGAIPSVWAAHPLWATNSTAGANVAIHLDRPVPEGGSAVLRLGSLSIPLKEAGTWELRIPEGPSTPFALRTTRGAAALLSISAPEGGATDPIHLDDPAGVFRVREDSPPERRLSVRRAANDAPVPASGGEGHLCVFDVRFANYDTREPAPDNECIHDAAGIRRLTLQFSDPVHAGMMPTWSSPTISDIPGWIELSVSDHPGDSDTASATYTSPQLVCGSKMLTASIHRCMGGVVTWCHACGMYHDAYEEGVCPHANNCPEKTNETAACTCIVPAVRVSDAVHGFWHDLGYYYPRAASCCCEPDIGLAKARLAFKSSNLSIADTNRIYEVGDYLPGAAWVSATEISGSEPSKIIYDIIHFHSDGNGGTTEEVVRTETNQLWAIALSFEPIATLTNSYGFVNPSAIVCGNNATFELAVLPQAFPESRIKWNADPLNRISFPSGNIGRQVLVHAGSLPTSSIRLRATIDGYYGPEPECWFDVVSETSVQVHALIVGNGFRFAYQASDIPNLLSGANRIRTQAPLKPVMT